MFCPQCGEAMPAGGRFCSHCGSGVSTAGSIAPPSVGFSWRRFAIPLMAVIALLLVVAGVLFFYNSKTPPVLSTFVETKKNQDLDRETAMKLLGGKTVETVEGSFDASLNDAQFAANILGDRKDLVPLFRELLNAGIIACNANNVCQPGPNGSSIRIQGGIFGSSDLIFTAGTLVPSAITGVIQTGPNMATADVQLSFQPTSMYQQHQAAFDQVNRQTVAGAPLNARTQGRPARAFFQRYDDGWRLQSIQ